MQTATLEAPQVQNGSTRRIRAPRTPRSMVPKQADAAVSTPKEIDYAAVVRSVMAIANKSGLGQRLVSNKSKQHIFALACDAVRSLRNLPKFVTAVVDGKEQQVPNRLPDSDAAAIRAALNDVWGAELLKFLSYGGAIEQSDLRIAWDLPKTTVIKPEHSKARNAKGEAIHDLDVRLKANATVSRAPKDVSEAILCTSIALGKAKNRLQFMQDRPGKYERDEIKAQSDLITLHEWKLQQLEALKAHQARQMASIAVLDADLSAGRISQEQYAEARKQVESAVAPAIA